MQPTDDAIKKAIDQLSGHIERLPVRLSELSIDELLKHEPGKWSRQEVLGHLIDSALNNLKRFADAPLSDGPYLLQGYRQDDLVRANRYQQLPLPHLLTLWSSLNMQIIYVAEAIPAETLDKTIRFSESDVEDRTLGWLIDDYVVHLEHHLKTLF